FRDPRSRVAKCAIGARLQRSGVDLRDSPRPPLHLVVHVCRSSRPVPNLTIPETDEPHLVHSARESAVEQPAVPALERIYPVRQRDELFVHDANRVRHLALERVEAITPPRATG